MIIPLFITVVFVVSICFVLTLRTKVARLIQSAHDIVDNAIQGKEQLAGYEETSLSALENKMHRFISLSQANTNTIEHERTKIKQLISDISHQTKTPIANIMIYSQLLLENEALSETNKQLVTDITIQSEKLSWLIQSLIKMSRLETGIITANQQLIPVIHTITRSVKAVFASADEKRITIKVYCDEAISAYHDSKWTSEALINILENAIKYTPSGGKVSISVQQYEMFTRIDIRDTGIGIAEHEITNIFKRFYRCEAVSEYFGVGIGLFLVREILFAQGGYIKAASKLGQGSTFSVFLPSSK